ncbi:phage portal protein [Clostridium cadaveris]|uniref:phage portal protein n=1 Tax=Clostridium cadaveris TaxID=1529 RepID=UPI000C078B3E|nr:phage portal protein [Clostridium cadaveris]
MDINRIKAIIRNDQQRRKNVLEHKKYYEYDNDIKTTGIVPIDSNKDPLRQADNRIAHNFHELLVNEKAAYMFTYPVLFDIDDNKNKLNDVIVQTLGDDFESISKNLCIEASNAGVAWLHYWYIVDEKGRKKSFEYVMVETEQVVPVYSKDLKKKLVSVFRYYPSVEELENGQYKNFVYFEYWTEDKLEKYKFEGYIDGADIRYIPDAYEEFKHGIGAIPFIEFVNNKTKRSDLSRYRDLIDLYDKVMSGFANDLEDIQQIIYILENYGGTDLKEFLGDLKRYKAIKTENNGVGSSGGVKTLQIEIPVEARKVILDILKKQIYESGQGLQQDTESFGNASGVALKFFYRKLELKSGLTETEFRKGFNKLIRAILHYLGKDENLKIQQTYTRNMISNDLENAQIAQASVGVIPNKYILRNHPWIDDPEEAEELMKKENEEIDPYLDLNNKGDGNE